MRKKVALLDHVKMVHEGQKGKYECNSCEKTFYTSQQQEIHINNVHKKLKLHKCNICGKLFSQNGHLGVHIRTIHQNL